MLLKGKVLGLVLSSLLSVGANEVETTKIETPKKEVIVQENEQKEEINEVVNRYAEYEKLEEQRKEEFKERVKQEMVNDKEFMNKYNEIKKINDDYQSFIKDRKYGSHYMADQHDEVENEWAEEWTEKLYGMELNEESVLRELANTLAFDISRHQFCDEICLVEECIRETNN